MSDMVERVARALHLAAQGVSTAEEYAATNVLWDEMPDIWPGTMSPKGVLIDLGFAAKRLGCEGDGQGAGQTGLPEPLVYYLRALEAAYLDMRAEQKKRSLQEIGWKFSKEPQDETT